MLGKASDPLLEKTEQALISKVAPNLKDAMIKVIHAGLTIMYSPQLAQQRNQRLAQANNPPQDAAGSASRLMAELYKQSKGAIPKPVLIPSTIVLALEYLDLVAKLGKVKITPNLIAQATQDTCDAMLAGMGVNQQQLTSMIQAKKGAQPAPGIVGAPQQGA